MYPFLPNLLEIRWLMDNFFSSSLLKGSSILAYTQIYESSESGTWLQLFNYFPHLSFI